MVDCNACGEKDLTWDQSWFENTGKWRLWSAQKESPHLCHKNKPKEKIIKKISCPKCNALGIGRYIQADKFQEHIKTEHIDWGDYD